jgi:hypothetical protein
VRKARLSIRMELLYFSLGLDASDGSSGKKRDGRSASKGEGEIILNGRRRCALGFCPAFQSDVQRADQSALLVRLCQEGYRAGIERACSRRLFWVGRDEYDRREVAVLPQTGLDSRTNWSSSIIEIIATFDMCFCWSVAVADRRGRRNHTQGSLCATKGSSNILRFR